MSKGLSGKALFVLMFILLAFATHAAATTTGQTADSLFNLSAASLIQGDTAEAAAVLDAALETNPKHWEAHIRRGTLYLAAGEENQASKQFTAALKSDSKRTRSMAHTGLGNIQAGMVKKGMQALKLYRIAIKTDPSNLEAYHKGAQISLVMGNPDSYRNASEFLLELICLDPTYKGAYETWRDRILDKQNGELRRVNDCLAAHLENSPEDNRWLLDMAEYFYRLQEIDSSLAALRRLESAEPGYKISERNLLLARCLLEHDDTLGFEDAYWDAVDAAEQEEDFRLLAVHAEAIFLPDEQEMVEKIKTADMWTKFFRAFWGQRDPDPFTSHNERLVEHYRRLLHVRQKYAINDVYSRTRTSEDFFRMDAYKAFAYSSSYNYDPMIFFNRCPELALQERGLLYLRHGQPDKIIMYNESESVYNIPVNTEVWYYDNVFFPWREGGSSIGDYRFIPVNYDGIADMEESINSESFKDPLPRLNHDCSWAVFMAPDGGSQLEIYQAISIEETEQQEPPVSELVVFDDYWSELARDSIACMHVKINGREKWMGVNSVSLPPGIKEVASRIDIPGFRIVDRQSAWVRTFYHNTLELSGIILGSPVQPASGVYSRSGVELLPRPSLSYTAGEIMTVYFEVYGLGQDSTGARRFKEAVTISRTTENPGLFGKVKRLFGSGGEKRSSDLTLAFERESAGDGQTVAEYFTVDTSLLLPGEYRIGIQAIASGNGGNDYTWNTFQLVEEE